MGLGRSFSAVSTRQANPPRRASTPRSARACALVAAVLSSALALPAGAEEQCRLVEVSFEPTAHLQIAVWVEDEAGQYVDTIYVTRSTGALGLGNRPGHALFKSAYRWPYGRREMVLPVWAHKRNRQYGYVVMGGERGIDPTDDSIGYHEIVSSTEPFYCPPSSLPLDAVSCASPFVGSKGVYAEGKTSLYPPRADLASFSAYDSKDAKGFASVNDVAAISGATPAGRRLLDPPLRWVVPTALPDGRYRIMVEASLEEDFNEFHHYPTFPDRNVELRSFGRDVLGQPSVVWSVPVWIDGTAQIATTDTWEGYGSWDGSDGALRPPDGTLSEMPGSGAGRLLPVSDADGTWRVKVYAADCQGCTTPGAPGPITATPADTSITLTFTAPASSSGLDAARRYDIRYRPDTPLTAESFAEGIPADTPPPPGAPGSMQTVKLTGLKAETRYHVGVRSVNVCGGLSTAEFATASTERQQFTVLHGCYIATAAYGSPLEREVELLRRVRDQVLQRSPLGRLAIAVYYATSPAMAAAISTNEHLRELARSSLTPMVALARSWLLTQDARDAARAVIAPVGGPGDTLLGRLGLRARPTLPARVPVAAGDATRRGAR